VLPTLFKTFRPGYHKNSAPPGNLLSGLNNKLENNAAKLFKCKKTDIFRGIVGNTVHE
jgi:hypothetical protein